MQEEHEGWADPDRDTSAQASVTGGAGTYNHLSDAMATSINNEMATNMYNQMATNMYNQMATNMYNEMATNMYNEVRELAVQDAALWNTGIVIDQGYQQIITEWIPQRSQQLLGPYVCCFAFEAKFTYKAKFAFKAIVAFEAKFPFEAKFAFEPGPVVVQIADIKLSATDAGQSYLVLLNPGLTAVDISGWALDGAIQFAFEQVLPASTSMYRSRAYPNDDQSPKPLILMYLSGTVLSASTTLYRSLYPNDNQSPKPLILMYLSGTVLSASTTLYRSLYPNDNQSPKPLILMYLAGTVLPASTSMYVSPDVLAFRQRPISPAGNEGNFVVGPMLLMNTAPGQSVKLFNEQQAQVHETWTY
eukprot:gene18043-24460_t